MSNLPTGTVTFLFTDIEGSTKLALDHPGTWETLRQRHHIILQSAIDMHYGYVFQIIGDAFCVAFHNAGDALQTAIQAQLDLHAENWGDTPVMVRMGIHTGKAEIQEGGQYIGYATLSRAQRVTSAGYGGQTLLSLAAQEMVRDDLPADIRLRDMGEHRLKDLIHAEHIYQVDIPNLPYDFPALKTLDVQLNNLPVQLTPFVGREREIAAVSGLLRNPDVRLVTLTGAGGTGKTRLSLQVAADLLDEYEHGAWFVELASITDPDLVLPTIASTLKVKESAGKFLEHALHEFLSHRQQLLVIDNFEQVVSAAPLIGSLLAAAPNVKVLVSSREVLHVRGEHAYPVPPLGLPESNRKQTAAVLAQYEAIALFIHHARAANPSFELNDDNATNVTEICTRLDGLPLAIELAAARSRLLKPKVMLEKLKSRLRLLTGGARDLPRRQQTIRSTIDWSYEMLDPEEKVLFVRLGIFNGGWTMESAETVCSQGLALDVLSGMESLLDKSLLRQVDGGSFETRFTMLETIREYACEKLAHSGELPGMQQALARCMNELLEKVISATSGPDEVTWYAELDDELDNLRTVVEWALKHNQPVFVFKVGELWAYFSWRANLREPLGWLERALVMDAGDALLERAKAMKNAGNLLAALEDDRRARGYYESALDLFRQTGDQTGIYACLNNLGNMDLTAKHFDEARQLYEQSLAGQEAESIGASKTLQNLGDLARIRSDWRAAKYYYLQSRNIYEHLGAESGIYSVDWSLGTLATLQRELIEAGMHFENCMNARRVQVNSLYRNVLGGFPGYVHLLLGNKTEALRLLNQSLESTAEFLYQHTNLLEFWLILEGKARLEILDGRMERATQLFGASWTEREKYDYALSEAERPDYEAAIAEARSAIGNDAFDQAFAKGQAMNIKQAVLFALDQPVL